MIELFPVDGYHLPSWHYLSSGKSSLPLRRRCSCMFLRSWPSKQIITQKNSWSCEIWYVLAMLVVSCLRISGDRGQLLYFLWSFPDRPTKGRELQRKNERTLLVQATVFNSCDGPIKARPCPVLYRNTARTLSLQDKYR